MPSLARTRKTDEESLQAFGALWDQLNKPGAAREEQQGAVAAAITLPNLGAATLNVTTPGVPLAGLEPALGPPLPGMPNETTLYFTWAAPFDNGFAIKHYHLRIDQETNLSLPASITECTLVSLLPGSLHKVEVRAVNALGQADEVGPYSVEIDTPPTPADIFFRQPSKLLRNATGRCAPRSGSAPAWAPRMARAWWAWQGVGLRVVRVW